MSEQEVVAGTAIEKAGEERQAMTVFGTDDPVEVMRRTASVARELSEFVREQDLSVDISGSQHIRVEGWQVVGMMFGLTALITETREIGEDDGWESWAEIRDRTGRRVGAGESQCLRREARWRNAEGHAVRSMAQTRAIGRAWRNTLGFIAKAAGYDPVPAEEADGGNGNGPKTQTVRRPSAPKTRSSSRGAKSGNGKGLATVNQRKMIFARFKAAGGEDEGELRAILKWVVGNEHTDRIEKAKVDEVLAAVEDREGTLAAIYSAAEDADRPDGPDARDIVDRFLNGQEGQQSLG